MMSWLLSAFSIEHEEWEYQCTCPILEKLIPILVELSHFDIYSDICNSRQFHILLEVSTGKRKRCKISTMHRCIGSIQNALVKLNTEDSLFLSRKIRAIDYELYGTRGKIANFFCRMHQCASQSITADELIPIQVKPQDTPEIISKHKSRSLDI